MSSHLSHSGTMLPVLLLRNKDFNVEKVREAMNTTNLVLYILAIVVCLFPHTHTLSSFSIVVVLNTLNYICAIMKTTVQTSVFLHIHARYTIYDIHQQYTRLSSLNLSLSLFIYFYFSRSLSPIGL